MTDPTPPHRSLGRQLRRLGLSADAAPDLVAWQDLLAVVSRSYTEADEERYTLERSLDVSTAEMGQLHDALRRRARHDTLTGLPNRAALVELLHGVVVEGRTGAQDAAVLFIDLDGFKLVNDSLGHRVGDGLLVGAAERICASVRPDDVVARLGGDEFVVLCPGVAAEAAAGIARRIGVELQSPFSLPRGPDSTATVTASVSCSIGLAMATGAGTADQLLANADMAMYEAKAQGRARFVVFDEAMRARSENRMDLEGALWQVLERGELEVHYQPVVDLQGGRMLSAEALVRWRRPGIGLVPPSAFIPIAEQSRLITVIDGWVLEEACRQAAGWADGTTGISVNLSTRDIQAEGFVTALEQVLGRTGLEPSRLTLELTETALMSDAEGATAVLGEAGALGVRTAIDDFGTGYWSMSHLRRLPVHMLKIDQGIVADVVDDPTAATIVRAIIAMGHALGLAIVAEGIRTGPQAEVLAELGCDAGQGYWFARPRPGPPSVTQLVPAARRG